MWTIHLANAKSKRTRAIPGLRVLRPLFQDNAKRANTDTAGFLLSAAAHKVRGRLEHGQRRVVAPIAALMADITKHHQL